MVEAIKDKISIVEIKKIAIFLNFFLIKIMIKGQSK